MKVVATEPIEAVNEQEGPQVVRLVIPADLYKEYEDLATRQDLSVAELMLHRLQRCATHSSIRSLYFHTSQLQQLETLLQKKPIADSEHALALLKAAMSVRVGDFPPVPITAQQNKRLAMSAYGGQSVYDRICTIVQGAVARATGA